MPRRRGPPRALENQHVDILLCDHQTFVSLSNGDALKVTLARLVPEVRGAKSATLVIVIHGVNSSDTRVSFPFSAGPDGLHWEDFTTLLDSGSSTGVAQGTSHPGSATDVTRFMNLQVSVKVERTSGGAAAQKSVTISAWLSLKPF